MRYLLAIAILAIVSALHAQTLPVVVSSAAYCATSVDGSVVGTPNPLSATINTTSSGSLAPGTYYTMYEWYDAAGHVTLPSPETRSTLSVTGSLVVNPPASGMPATAVGMDVFIAATSGGETLQGQTVGAASYVQSAALTSGASPTMVNNTLCQVIANDAGWPSGTGYKVTMTDSDGNAIPGFPMQWQLLGAGSTYNLSNGLPYYHGVVTYPVPILSQPQNHGTQSITGSLDFTGYNVLNVGKLGIGTSTPGWPLDVENGPINTSAGILINGSGGTSGQCLGSDGTSYNLSVPCASSGAGSFYQNVALNGTVQTQRSILNFNSSVLTVTDSASPSQTTINLATTGSDAEVATAAAPGVNGHCVRWTATGGLGDAGASCVNGGGIPRTCNTYGCYQVDGNGTVTEWINTGNTPTPGMGTQTLPYPLASVCQTVQATTLSSTDRITYINSCTPGSPSTVVVQNNGSGAQAYITVVGW